MPLFGKKSSSGKKPEPKSKPRAQKPGTTGSPRSKPVAPSKGAKSGAAPETRRPAAAAGGGATEPVKPSPPRPQADTGGAAAPSPSQRRGGPDLKVVLPVIVVLAAIFVSMLMAVFKPRPAVQDQSAQKAMLVNAMTVEQKDVKIKITSQGRVQPITKTSLISEVSGAVTEVSPQFVTGGFVSEGQVLLRLDDRNYRAAVEKAKANLAAAHKRLIEEKGRAQVQEREFKRSGRKQRSQEATDLYLRKPHLREAEATYESARAELERVKGDLEKTVVRAPYDGLVQRRHVDLAQYVTPGTKLADIVSIDVAEVRLAIPQDRLAYMALPMPAADDPSQMDVPAQNALDGATGALDDAGATDNTPAAAGGRMAPGSPAGFGAQGSMRAGSPAMTFPDVVLTSRYGADEFQWQGKLVRTEGMFDEDSHVLHVIAQVEDPYRIHKRTADDPFDSHVPLLLGSYVKAEIEGRLFEGITVIPRHTLRAGNQVWVIDDNMQLRNRQVEILNTGGDLLYVTDGLRDGDRICLTHVGDVVPGTKVRLQSSAGAGAESELEPGA